MLDNAHANLEVPAVEIKGFADVRQMPELMWREADDGLDVAVLWAVVQAKLSKASQAGINISIGSEPSPHFTASG